MEVYEGGRRVLSVEEVRQKIIARIKRIGPCRSNYLFNAFGVTYPTFEHAIKSLIEDGLIRQRLSVDAPRYDPEWEISPWYGLKVVIIRLRDMKDYCVALWYLLRS